MTRTLVIGASGGIGQGVTQNLLNDNNVEHISTVSRTNKHTQDNSLTKLEHFFCDWSEQSIHKTVQALKKNALFDQVIICTGMLQHQQIKPEKRLEEVQAENLHLLFYANSIVPMLWLTHLPEMLNNRAVIGVLSAKVGSISDNHLGGWYAYRASKAALNMLIKTVAIEYERRCNQVKLIAFHPGTTDTALSKPYQTNVAKDKLFSTSFVANQLLTIMRNCEHNGQAEFIDWQGKTLPW